MVEAKVDEWTEVAVAVTVGGKEERSEEARKRRGERGRFKAVSLSSRAGWWPKGSKKVPE